MLRGIFVAVQHYHHNSLSPTFTIIISIELPHFVDWQVYLVLMADYVNKPSHR